MTSMAITIKDVYLSMCYVYYVDKSTAVCYENKLLLSILPGLPFLMRFFQVCNQTYHNPKMIHAYYLNLIRYPQFLILFTISYFGLQNSDESYIWVSVFIIFTEYTMILDVYQD